MRLQAMRTAEPDGGASPALTVEMAPVAFAPPVPEETPVAAEPVPSGDHRAGRGHGRDRRSCRPIRCVLPEPAKGRPPTKRPTVPAETEAEKAERVAPEIVTPEVPTEVERRSASRPQPVEETAPEIAETVAPEVVLPIPQPKPIQPEAESTDVLSRRRPSRSKKKETKPVQAKKKDVKPAEKVAEAKKKPSEEGQGGRGCQDRRPSPQRRRPRRKRTEEPRQPRVTPANGKAKVHRPDQAQHASSVGPEGA